MVILALSVCASWANFGQTSKAKANGQYVAHFFACVLKTAAAIVVAFHVYG